MTVTQPTKQGPQGSKLEDRQKNTVQANTMLSRALHYARAKLKAEGIDYPAFDSNLPVSANYELLEAYKEKEIAHVNYYLKHPSGPRPTENFPKREDWQSKYD